MWCFHCNTCGHLEKKTPFSSGSFLLVAKLNPRPPDSQFTTKAAINFSIRFSELNVFSKMSNNSWDVYLVFSLWHLAKALQRLGSGHRSRGDWPFLLRMVKSAPLAARKQAMDAALFFSAPWVPKPMINCRVRHKKQKKSWRTGLLAQKII